MRVLCLFLVLAFLAISQDIYCQTRNQAFGFDPVNTKYLEHLIKIKTDSVRQAHGCKVLVNDSVLYTASVHHSEYMLKNDILTHDEKGSAKFRSPQSRVEYYGGKNYLSGENVLVTYYNSVVTDKYGKADTTNTYESLANAIVKGWVNSPGHFKNMINPEYQITGVSVAMDAISKKVYACQNFAVVPGKFEFTESKTLFSYSEYLPPKQVTSFDEVPNTLLDCDHEWGVEHNDPEKCISCLKIIQEQPFITLQNVNGSFILRVDNSDYVKNLMINRKDGFAVEIVEYNDYMCGNPAYYVKPSRRNHQCALNGKLLEPLYRDDLMKGYKQRKKKKEVQYLSYIFSSDSIPFFKRFYTYKVDRFSSKYFEINLGKVPSNTNGLFEYNLVYLQKNEICHVDYFIQLCPDLYLEPEKPVFIPLKAEGDYHFLPVRKKIHFVVPFEQNQSEFSEADLKPFFDSLSNISYMVDSIKIKAFASIEGDSILNRKLHEARARNIVAVIQKNQSGKIPTTVESKTNWEHFFAEIRKYPKWRFLAEKDKAELSVLVAGKFSDSLEFILSKERYASIDVFYSVDTTEANLKYFISTEFRLLSDTINRFRNNGHQEQYLSKLENLYKFAHRKVVENKLTPEFLAGLTLPKSTVISPSLKEKYLMYGLEFNKAFSSTRYWKDNETEFRNELGKQSDEYLSPEYIYYDCLDKAEMLENNTVQSLLNAQTLIARMQHIDAFYYSSDTAKINMDKLYFNLCRIMLEKDFALSPLEFSKDAFKSIKIVYSYYNKYNLLNTEKALQLAKICNYYQFQGVANEILEPFLTNDTVIAYYLCTGYMHSSFQGSAQYYRELISYSESMGPEIWCNMFMSECGIPFQAFDNEELRNAFCRKCASLNKTVIEINKGF